MAKFKSPKKAPISGFNTNRFAELCFLLQEPELIELTWKIAGIPKRGQKRLLTYLDSVGDLSLVNVTQPHGSSGIVFDTDTATDSLKMPSTIRSAKRLRRA